MPHFFVPPENIRNDRFFLNPEESRHVAVVLRKKPGDDIRLFDGVNKSYRAKISSVAPDRVEGDVIDAVQAPRLPYRLRLFQGLPKGDKFELILEKMTELGVAEVFPIETERSIPRIPDDRLIKRLERWRKIVRAAAEQCGRVDVPEVSAPLSFSQALSACRSGELTLVPWESESRTSLKSALCGATATIYNVFIGPEGGFSPSEVDRARAAGAVPVTLGPFILRTETAGLAAAAAILFEKG